jgi:hypothetical protein
MRNWAAVTSQCGGHFLGFAYYVCNMFCAAKTQSPSYGWKSYDRDARPIGLFDSEELAARAVYEQANAAPLTEAVNWQCYCCA